MCPQGNTKQKAIAVVQSKVPGFIWVLTLSVAGGFGGLLVYLAGQNDAETLPELSTVKAQATQAIQSAPAAKPAAPSELGEQIEQAKKALSFYKLLTEQEVEVPPADKPLAEAIESKEQSTTGWILQAASFRAESDADSMRAMLILNGLSDVYIEPVEVADKGTFYRVLIGPITNRSRMNSIKDVLVDADIAPIERRVTLTP